MKFIDEGYALPLTLALGLSYNLPVVTITSDVNYYDHQTPSGWNQKPAHENLFSLTLGYTAGKDNKLGWLAGLARLGIYFKTIELGYAWVPYGELTIRIE